MVPEKNIKNVSSVSLREVTYFANISAKTNLSAKPFYPVYQGHRRVSFIESKGQQIAAINVLPFYPLQLKTEG